MYVHSHGNQLVAKGDRFELVATGRDRTELQANVRSLMALECAYDILPQFRFCCGVVDLRDSIPVALTPDDADDQNDMYLLIEKDELGMHARSLDDLFQLRQLSEAPDAFIAELTQMVKTSRSLEHKPSRLLLFLDHEVQPVSARLCGASH